MSKYADEISVIINRADMEDAHEYWDGYHCLLSVTLRNRGFNNVITGSFGVVLPYGSKGPKYLPVNHVITASTLYSGDQVRADVEDMEIIWRRS